MGFYPYMKGDFEGYDPKPALAWIQERMEQVEM